MNYISNLTNTEIENFSIWDYRDDLSKEIYI